LRTLNHTCGIAAIVLAAAALSGCTGEDGLSEEEAELLREAENTIAEGVVSSGVDLLAGVLNSFPEWSSGEFAPAIERESVSWNEADQAWMISSVEEYGDDQVNGVADFTVWIQFRADGVSVQEPSEAVQEMEVRLDGTNLGRYESERFVTEYDWSVDFNVIAVRSGESSKHFIGTGHLQGFAETEARGQKHVRPQEFAWEFDLMAPAASSCAKGTLTGVMDSMMMSADFLEEGQVSWSLTRDGSIVQEGEAEYGCGQFDPVW